MRSTAPLAIVFAACWRGDGAAPESTSARAPIAYRRPVRLPPRTEPIDLGVPEVLARTLRTVPHLALGEDGPIVVLDFDTGAIETLCDRDARDAQDAWSTLLADPARGAPSCGLGPTWITCMQISDRPLLIIHFSREGPIRPVQVMTGHSPRSSSSVTAQMLKQAVQAARCP